MELIKLVAIERYYKNNGQEAERVARFTLTGELVKADNLAHNLGSDCLDIQIKSARATVCKGTDLNAYLDLDASNRFGYVTADFEKLYIMNREEYTEFVNQFGTVTRESGKNGGAEKIRLKHESKEMVEWFKARA